MVSSARAMCSLPEMYFAMCYSSLMMLHLLLGSGVVPLLLVLLARMLVQLLLLVSLTVALAAQSLDDATLGGRCAVTQGDG